MGFEIGRRGLGGVRSPNTYLIAYMGLGSLITVDKNIELLSIALRRKKYPFISWFRGFPKQNHF